MSAADRETARQLLDQGDALYADKKFEQAASKYKQADAIMGVPTTTLPYGKALEGMGLLVEARDAYLRVIRYSGESNAAFDEAKVEADKLAAAVAPKIATLQLKVNGAEGAELSIRIDKKKVAGGAVDRSVNPGEHVVEVSAEGFKTAQGNITLGEGETKALELTLEPAPADAPPPEPTPEPAPDKPDDDGEEGGGFPIFATIGFSVGAVGIGVGIATGIMSLGKEGDLAEACGDDKACPADPSLVDKQDSAILLANISNVGFIVGGAGVVFGIVALFTLDADDGSDTASITPLLGPGYAGVRGSF